MSSTSSSHRGQQKERTRSALLERARELFAERGFPGTQVSDIARAAGVAHGTFYVHFENKERLLDELLLHHNEALVLKLARAWRPDAQADPLSTAGKLAEICLDHWRAERGLVLAFAQRAGVDGSIESLRDGINPQVGRLLGERLAELGARLGQPTADPMLLAQALLGMWTRVAMQHLFGNVPRKRAVELLASLSVGALRAAFPVLSPS